MLSSKVSRNQFVRENVEDLLQMACMNTKVCELVTKIYESLEEKSVLSFSLHMHYSNDDPKVFQLWHLLREEAKFTLYLNLLMFLN